MPPCVTSPSSSLSQVFCLGKACADLSSSAQSTLRERVNEVLTEHGVSGAGEVRWLEKLVLRNETALSITGARTEPLTQSQIDTWVNKLVVWGEQGIAGVWCARPMEISSSQWQMLIKAVRLKFADFVFLAWTPGLTPRQIGTLASVGFSATALSLPWWDGQADWLLQERIRLSKIAPVLAPVLDPDAGESAQHSQNWSEASFLERRLWMAAFFGDSILLTPAILRSIDPDMLKRVVAWIRQRSGTAIGERQGGRPRLFSLVGPLAQLAAFGRDDGALSVLVLNRNEDAPVAVDWQVLASRLPDDYVLQGDAHSVLPDRLPAGGLVMAQALHADLTSAWFKQSLIAERIAIENVTPAVDDGRFAAKSCIGDEVRIAASIFGDGHGRIAATLLWQCIGDEQWRSVPMQYLENDAWQASFYPQRVGAHVYFVRAWRDDWTSFSEYVGKKSAAQQDTRLEVREGISLLKKTAAHARQTAPEAVISIESAIDAAQADPDQAIDILLSASLAQAMRSADPRPFEASSVHYPLTVDRRRARFASWYELFPRSQSDVPEQHGTFRDVIRRLPAIADMGFDVLYFPPIHPIGLANRKGKNNALRAGEGDPGSPYAIGSQEGGHDALHPALGSLDDFQALIRAAHGQGLEIAMDFAVQCSPDHPWLQQHPEWFDWRADGSLRYAENPPKRYEDIVNPEFYLEDGQPRQDLWEALRDVVLYWAGQGVYTFRVDNPHTKPLPFWQWMIGEVKGRYPQTLFLSEAFTRPKMMYRLAKAGFSQSYTYFTWRNTKRELTDYLTELNSTPVCDFFRPNFFVNTPDINPFFLQTSGRAGFLIRAALAATLSGLWGMYSGFELCEAAALPGKEEYQDSEKYQLRRWNHDRPGNIIADITQLNQLRRDNPALHTHLGIQFQNIDNEQILFYTKCTSEGDNIVIVVISLDPHGRQSGTLQLPLWQWGIADHAPVPLHDLMTDQQFELIGPQHRIDLSPEHPFVIWRLRPQ